MDGWMGGLMLWHHEMRLQDETAFGWRVSGTSAL